MSTLALFLCPAQVQHKVSSCCVHWWSFFLLLFLQTCTVSNGCLRRCRHEHRRNRAQSVFIRKRKQTSVGGWCKFGQGDHGLPLSNPIVSVPVSKLKSRGCGYFFEAAVLIGHWWYTLHCILAIKATYFSTSSTGRLASCIHYNYDFIEVLL